MKRPMICVPIVEKTEQDILAQAKKCVVPFVELVEWRIDCYQNIHRTEAIGRTALQIKKIIGERPLLITFRTQKEGGDPNGSRADYADMIRFLIGNRLCDYIDVELQKAAMDFDLVVKKAHNAGIKVIGSYHNFSETPGTETLWRVMEAMAALGADVAKVAAMPQSESDVDRLLALTETADHRWPQVDIITMSMDEMGKRSRIYGGLYGSKVTFGCIGKPSAPGQIEAKTLAGTLDKLYPGKKHICLIGYMGVGKTTISRELVGLTGMKAVDTDLTIEQIHGMSIKDIFETNGEEFFRQAEERMIDTLAGMPDSIVSCGGGMPLRDLNAKKLRAMGNVIWLTATPETIFQRVFGQDQRPLLNGNMNMDYIIEMMAEREPLYRKAADYVVKTDDKSAIDIAREIIENIG